MEENAEPLVLEEGVDEEARDYEINVTAEAPSKENEAPSWTIKKAEPAKPMKPAPEMVQKKPEGAKMKKHDLRRAVAWSEILAKPLSLRD
jgi:hypothetical protein